MSHGDMFRMNDLVASEREALADIYIDMGDRRVSAHEIMCGMQNTLDEYKNRLDSMREVNKSLNNEKEQEAHNLKAAHNSTRKELAYRCQVMQEVCGILAESGGYDHKSKNEAILRAIAILLQHSNPVTEFTRAMNMDDIPF